MVIYNYIFIGFLLIAGVVFALAPLVVVFLIAPRKRSSAKYDIYECGVKTHGETWVRFRIQYYIFALMFVVFDIETVFLYPWAASYASMSEAAREPAVDLNKIDQVGSQGATPPAPEAAAKKKDAATETQQATAVEEAAASKKRYDAGIKAVSASRSAAESTGSAGLAWFPLLEMVVFLLILFAGLAYAWAKGVLRWV
jgi:NADH-quinone oxidoreductase subunit A